MLCVYGPGSRPGFSTAASNLHVGGQGPSQGRHRQGRLASHTWLQQQCTNRRKEEMHKRREGGTHARIHACIHPSCLSILFVLGLTNLRTCLSWASSREKRREGGAQITLIISINHDHVLDKVETQLAAACSRKNQHLTPVACMHTNWRRKKMAGRPKPKPEDTQTKEGKKQEKINK